MNLETRLRKLEKRIIKSSGFTIGMKIMERITEASSNNREAIPDLLIKLWENGIKSVRKK